MIELLIVSPVLPYPTKDGDSLRHYNLIKRLSAQCNIYLVAFAGDEQFSLGIPEMQKYCKEVHAIPNPKLPRSKWAVRYANSLIHGNPMYASVFFEPNMRSKVKELLSRKKFDIVQIEHTYLAQYLTDAKNLSSAKTFLTVHNLESISFLRQCRHEPFGQDKIRLGIDSLAFRRIEPWAIKYADGCVTVSEKNAELIRQIGRKDVVVVENGVDINFNLPVAPNSDSKELLFLGGMSYPPNVDGAVYMANEIFPLIRKQIPEVKLNIVGRSPDPRVLALDGIEGITVCGDVPDVRPWYERSVVTTVPLRSGGGTRLKILESMALGVPVVSTSVGCEGLHVNDGEDILIADTPEDFANSVCSLMRSSESRAKIISNARRLVESRYSWDSIAPRLYDVYQNLLKK